MHFFLSSKIIFLNVCSWNSRNTIFSSSPNSARRPLKPVAIVTGQPSGTPGDQTIAQEIASADEIFDVGNRGTQEIAKNAEISLFTLFYLVSLSYQPCCREDDVDDDEHHDQPRLCDKGGGNRVHPRCCFSDTELIVFSDDGFFFNSWGLWIWDSFRIFLIIRGWLKVK